MNIPAAHNRRIEDSNFYLERTGPTTDQTPNPTRITNGLPKSEASVRIVGALKGALESALLLQLNIAPSQSVQCNWKLVYSYEVSIAQHQISSLKRPLQYLPQAASCPSVGIVLLRSYQQYLQCLYGIRSMIHSIRSILDRLESQER